MKTPKRQRGSALLALLVIVIICGGLAAAVLLPGVSDSRSADASLARERAFQLAESGVDWGLAVVRRANGVMPSPAQTQRTVGSLGDFVLDYTSGASNSFDDDGDGATDEADEIDFIYMRSTGRSGGAKRTIEVALRRNVQVPQIQAALQFNVTTPILDLNGNAFLISGVDHDIDGNVDSTLAQKHGIASPAPTADLVSQIPIGRQSQVQGLGGSPSISQVPSLDLATLVAQASTAAETRLSAGTYSTLALGTPTPSGMTVVYADGDIVLSGDGAGAGILVVDGDLDISGNFVWQGIVIVRGRVILTGGGTNKMIIGGLIVGEEVTSSVSTSSVKVTGTADMLYSSAAINMASQALIMMSVLSWNETASP